MINVQQSIPLSFGFACLSGFLKVVATGLLAYPDAKAKNAGKEVWSKCSLRLALVGNITLQVLSSTCMTFSSFFGPVALVRPTTTASQLVSNMIVFAALRLEFFPKDKQVGTIMAAVAALLLPVNGPGVQDNQDVVELLTQPVAIAWSALLMILTVGSTIYLLINKIKDLNQTWRIRLLLCVQVGAAVISTTTSKMVVLVGHPVSLAVVAVIWLLMGIIVLYAAVLQSTAVSQAVFIPIMVATDMVVNALTGIIVWEDWRVIDSWLGYGCVFVQLALGNYLLSSLDVFTRAAVRYGQVATISLGLDAASNPTRFFEDPRKSIVQFTSQHFDPFDLDLDGNALDIRRGNNNERESQPRSQVDGNGESGESDGRKLGENEKEETDAQTNQTQQAGDSAENSVEDLERGAKFNVGDDNDSTDKRDLD